jgi:hypothetical protein
MLIPRTTQGGTGGLWGSPVSVLPAYLASPESAYLTSFLVSVGNA